MPIVFLGDIHERNFSLKDADDEQRNFAVKIKNLDKAKKNIEKEFFYYNLWFLFSTREKALTNFKSKLLPIKEKKNQEVNQQQN